MHLYFVIRTEVSFIFLVLCVVGGKETSRTLSG
jgi:hypothetical protein